jgi:hypothetical protein
MTSFCGAPVRSTGTTLRTATLPSPITFPRGRPCLRRRPVRLAAYWPAAAPGHGLLLVGVEFVPVRNLSGRAWSVIAADCAAAFGQDQAASRTSSRIGARCRQRRRIGSDSG